MTVIFFINYLDKSKSFQFWVP